MVVHFVSEGMDGPHPWGMAIAGRAVGHAIRAELLRLPAHSHDARDGDAGYFPEISPCRPRGNSLQFNKLEQISFGSQRIISLRLGNASNTVGHDLYSPSNRWEASRMSSRHGRTTGWFLALLIGLGLTTAALIAAAKPVHGLTAVEQVQTTASAFVSPGPTRCQPPVSDVSFSPPLLATPIPWKCRDCGTAPLRCQRSVETRLPRPTFFDRVSYQTTGPPHVG